MASPDIAAQRIVAAVEAQDPVAYAAAGQDLVNALPAAGPDDIRPAIARLAPVLSGISLERGSGLAQVVGGMAWQVADTSPVLGVLVNRACEAMEGAARFLALHRELLGDPPDPQDTSAVRATVARFAAAAAASAGESRKLAFAWFASTDWVQPVLYLSQRADVRAALPQRERLLAAVESIRENLDVANWLHGVLLVLDAAAWADGRRSGRPRSAGRASRHSRAGGRARPGL